MIAGRALRGSRILVYPPGHPLLIGIYVFMAFIFALIASVLPSVALSGLAFSSLHLLALWMASFLILTSPLLSFFNVVVKRIESPEVEELRVEVEFIYVYGLPIAVPRLRVSRRVTIIALNLGGAAVPVFVSLILSWIAYSNYGSRVTAPIVASITVTSIITYLASRVVPGVGIAVPALIPPLTASLISMAIIGSGPVAAISAYTGGVMGSLIGADVLRLAKDFHRLQAPIVSIGGVGVFDGVFLSGIIGFILAL
ncbi:MAG: DUF1614 domain-containing protein [Desulfurococcales archaeon]|nr:DUF1614 domain-containing protein [Desulfurococcales archaeon]